MCMYVCELFPLFGAFVAHVADVDVACRLSPVAASKDQESRTMTAAGDTKQNRTKQSKTSFCMSTQHMHDKQLPCVEGSETERGSN